jgi:hypothetical protein
MDYENHQIKDDKKVGGCSKHERDENTRDIRKVTSGELLTKQATRQKYYIKNIHMVHTYLSYFST